MKYTGLTTCLLLMKWSIEHNGTECIAQDMKKRHIQKRERERHHLKRFRAGYTGLVCLWHCDEK